MHVRVESPKRLKAHCPRKYCRLVFVTVVIAAMGVCAAPAARPMLPPVENIDTETLPTGWKLKKGAVPGENAAVFVTYTLLRKGLTVVDR